METVDTKIVDTETVDVDTSKIVDTNTVDTETVAPRMPKYTKRSGAGFTRPSLESKKQKNRMKNKAARSSRRINRVNSK